VVEITQELHLAQGSEAKHGMVKWSNFLNSNFLPRRFVYRGAAHPLASVLRLDKQPRLCLMAS
jgi:hypothetical protein